MKLRLKSVFAFTLTVIFYSSSVNAQESSYVSFEPAKSYFPVVAAGQAAPIYLSGEDYPGVIRAAGDLRADIERVSGKAPEIFPGKQPAGSNIIIVGTIGKSKLVDDLIQAKKIDVADVRGKWEAFLIQPVEKPFAGVERALVIAGSDKRGTIFGIYDMSQTIGVSPWYWWADVPVKKHDQIFVAPGKHSQGEPAVKYRGIFINDEQPALGGWVRENYGGFNSKFYVKVFELILRHKGNFLWPAMWGQSFYTEDPLNPKLADEYGVVISTSHHEPMMRAHVEWQRANAGAWNYNTNEAALRRFWKEGVERMGNNESIVTLAMRGDGDEPMSEDANVKLLQKIVADQREIIKETTGKPLHEIPQVWALYKEVQDYYDKGMRVPDDVTLLLCDDNWGNIRKLPRPGEPPRAGGYGIYYHYDYVGGPRNYKWLNTNPIPRVWEQMNLAWEHKADRIWIVNVGDIKPMEFPISFFLDMAWDPEKFNPDNLKLYTQQWVEAQFGPEHAASIANILSKYTKYNARRKPELLAPDTYSLTHYREAERVVEEYNALAKEAQTIYDQLLPEYKDAYYQIILYPVLACANLNAMKVATGFNHLYAAQGRATANELASQVAQYFEKDKELSHYYNTQMAGGKWNHMMDQTHISYTYWQQPPVDVMPEVKTVTLPDAAEMGMSVEGSEAWWPDSKGEAQLPEFDVYNRQNYIITLFNRGKEPFNFKIESSAPWLNVNTRSGNVITEKKISVSVDWEKVKPGRNEASITVSGTGKQYAVKVTANNPEKKIKKGFIEANGFVSMEAIHYTDAVNANGIEWRILPDLGKTGSAITTFPVTAKSETPSEKSPRLEYIIHLSDTGEVKVLTYVSPTIDFLNQGGLQYAISVDDEKPQIVNIHSDKSNRAWERSVADNIIVTTTVHTIRTKGQHVLKFWRVDPAVVLQKIAVDTGGLNPSYLGPPESYFIK